MPKNKTDKVVGRTLKILKYLEQKGRATTAEIAHALGLSHSQAYYVLRELHKKGLIVRLDIGRKIIWMSKENSELPPKAEAIRKAICRVIKEHRGNRICMKARHVREYLPPQYKKDSTPGELTYYVEELLKRYGINYMLYAVYKPQKNRPKRKKVRICAEKTEWQKLCSKE